MKTIIKTLAFSLVVLAIMSTESLAQKKGPKKEKTSYKKETGPPPWAKAHGYRAKTRYVYFTDHNFYYDNNNGVYIYMSGNNWEVSASIPSLFRNVDLGVALKVDIDLEADDPQKFNADHKKKYKKS